MTVISGRTHKKGSKQICNNYHAISWMSCVGKVLEKRVQTHVLGYLKCNNLLTSSQSGFIPGDSTNYQLLCLHNDLCRALDKGIMAHSHTTIMYRIYNVHTLDKISHTELISPNLLLPTIYLSPPDPSYHTDTDTQTQTQTHTQRQPDRQVHKLTQTHIPWPYTLNDWNKETELIDWLIDCFKSSKP